MHRKSSLHSKAHNQQQERFRRKKDKEYLAQFSNKNVPKPQKEVCDSLTIPFNFEEDESAPIGCINIRNRLFWFLLFLGGIQFLRMNCPLVIVEAAEVPSARRPQDSTHSKVRSKLEKYEKPISQNELHGKDDNLKYFRDMPRFPAKDITQLKKACIDKTQGITPGKICIIEGVKYYLKRADYAGDNSLLAKHNLKLAEKIMGITVPKTQFFYDKDCSGNYYFASKGLEFTPAESLKKAWKPDSVFEFLLEMLEPASLDRNEVVRKNR